MKSDLCLHLGLCAQSSENCLEGTTAGVDTLFRGHEHSGRARDENQSDPCRRWKQSGDSLGEVDLTTSYWGLSSTGFRMTIVVNATCTSKAPTRTPNCSFQRRVSYRYSVGLAPHIWRNTRAKCCWVLKPQAMATSRTRISAEANISFALWTR